MLIIQREQQACADAPRVSSHGSCHAAAERPDRGRLALQCFTDAPALFQLVWNEGVGTPLPCR